MTQLMNGRWLTLANDYKARASVLFKVCGNGIDPIGVRCFNRGATSHSYRSGDCARETYYLAGREGQPVVGLCAGVV